MSSGLIIVKKEKVFSTLHPKRAHIDLTVKMPGSWERKTAEVTYLSLENLRDKEAFRKLVSFS